MAEQTRRPCIFCRKPEKLSKEHIWPVWLHRRAAGWGGTGHGQFIETRASRDAPRRVSQKDRQGGLHTKKIRAVCRRCNSGWMSELEKAVRPTVEELVEGKGASIGGDAIRTLIRWVAVKVVVCEHSNRVSAVTTPSERAGLMEGQIPLGFHVSLARISWNGRLLLMRFSQKASGTMLGPRMPMEGMPNNFQTVSLVVGPLLFHVFQCREPEITPQKFAYHQETGLPLHPNVPDAISSDLADALIDEVKLRSILRWHDQLDHDPGVRWVNEIGSTPPG